MSGADFPAQVLALLRWIEGQAALAAIGGAPAGAQQATAALAAQLAALDPATRRAAIGTDWPVEAGVLVLAAMPMPARAELAAELAVLADLPGLLDAALDLGAPEVGALLGPDSPASLLLQAVHALPEAVAYARRATAGVARLEDLPAALFATAAPSLVTRTAVILHAGLTRRLGADEALSWTRGVLMQRLLRPALAEFPGTALEHLLASEPTPQEQAVDEALNDYTDEILQAGAAAEAAAADGEDPDDLLVQRGTALESPQALTDTFRAPSPQDKFGTLPAVRVTALGQAILGARARRPGLENVAWARVVALEEEEPAGLEAVLLDERCEVMDLLGPA